MIYDILPINTYTGNNTSTRFDFDFYIENESQLRVYFFDENNIKHLLEYEIDYSIDEFKNKNGSYITFPLEKSSYETLKTNQKISLQLTLPISQETQYNNSSLVNYEELEYSFDYLTRLIQILSRKLALCVKVEECSNTSPDELIDSINQAAVTVENNKNVSVDVLNNINTINEHVELLQNEIDNTYQEFNQNHSALNSNLAALNQNKADINLSNIDNSAKALMSAAAAPSDKYIDFTLGADGDSYIAPADGWVFVNKASTGTNQHVDIVGEHSKIDERQALYSGAIITPSMKLKKGEKFKVFYNTPGTTNLFRFIYTEGAKSEEE